MLRLLALIPAVLFIGGAALALKSAMPSLTGVAPNQDHHLAIGVGSIVLAVVLALALAGFS